MEKPSLSFVDRGEEQRISALILYHRKQDFADTLKASQAIVNAGLGIGKLRFSRHRKLTFTGLVY